MPGLVSAVDIPPHATEVAVAMVAIALLALLWQTGRWRRAEQGRQRYDLLARHTRDIILFIRRRDGRIIEVNDAAVAAYRCSREALLAATIYQLRAPDGVSLVDAQMTDADFDGTLFETMHRRADGELFPVEVSSRGTTVGGERVLLSVIRDISERVSTARAQQESEQRLNAELRARVDELEHAQQMLQAHAGRLRLQARLIDRAHDAIVVRDHEGNVLSWNMGAAQLYGWTADEAVGRNMHDRLGTDEAVLAEICSALGNGVTDEWQGQLRQTRKDGTEVIAHSRHMRVPHGGTTLTLEISRDITDRVRAENERTRTLSRLRLLVDISEALSAAATPDEIVAVVLEKAVPALGAYAGNVALVASEGTEMEIAGSIGYDAAVSVGARLPLAGPSPLAEAIREGRLVMVVSREDWVQRYPEMFRERFSRPTHALAAIPIRGERIVGALGLSFKAPGELPDRDRAFGALVARQTAQALERASLLTSEREAHAQAAEASRLKDEFLATLSHELRTPLNAILGWSQMLASGSLKAESRDRALAVITRNARVQARLVEEVLDLSRMATGSLHLDVQDVDLSTVIERAIDTVRLAAGAKGVALETTAAGSLVVTGDPDRLQQVIWNLLSNAVKFTPAGGRVRVRAARLESLAEICVSDTGIGIEPGFLPHVFDRFTQADSSPTRRHGGLGLGLAIVRQIVELHGGTVKAASDGPHRGSSFRILLPVQSWAPAGTADERQAGGRALERLRVLGAEPLP